MKLRNAHLAVVERQKVVDYLLNAAHPDNSGKARFFESLGFSIEDPEHLMAALRALGENGDVVESIVRSTARNMLSRGGSRRTLKGAARGWSVRYGSSIWAARLRGS